MKQFDQISVLRVHCQLSHVMSPRQKGTELKQEMRAMNLASTVPCMGTVHRESSHLRVLDHAHVDPNREVWKLGISCFKSRPPSHLIQGSSLLPWRVDHVKVPSEALCIQELFSALTVDFCKTVQFTTSQSILNAPKPCKGERDRVFL